MEIAFVKTGDSHDRIHVKRDDGSESAWRWGASGPPHDLVHWVVESRVPLEGGFWGLVAAGADFGFVNSHAHGVAEHDAPSIGDTTQLLQAEAVVNAIQMGMRLEPRLDDEGCLQWTKRWCEQASVPVPPGLDAARFAELRAAAEEWAGRYRALETGSALNVSF